MILEEINDIEDKAKRLGLLRAYINARPGERRSLQVQYVPDEHDARKVDPTTAVEAEEMNTSTNKKDQADGFE
jgi:hypothetical protein